MRAGTIAFARTADGRECRSSGWGPAFLDPGSGYDIGECPCLCCYVLPRLRSDSTDAAGLLYQAEGSFAFPFTMGDQESEGKTRQPGMLGKLLKGWARRARQ